MGRRTAAERLWAKVLKQGPDECWVWQGNRHDVVKGYGRIKVGGRREFVHRFSWMLANGDPGELWVLHRCDNTLCVNPRHLFLGTVLDNNDDKVIKGRQAKGNTSGARRHPEMVARGERQHSAKLTEDHVRAIRLARRGGESYARLAARYGICTSTLAALLTGRTWKHVA